MPIDVPILSAAERYLYICYLPPLVLFTLPLYAGSKTSFKIMPGDVHASGAGLISFWSFVLEFFGVGNLKSFGQLTPIFLCRTIAYITSSLLMLHYF